MKQAFDIVNEWLGILTKVAVNLVLLGIIIIWRRRLCGSRCPCYFSNLVSKKVTKK